AHHDHGRGVFGIPIREQAAPDQGYAEGLEKAGAYGVIPGHRLRRGRFELSLNAYRKGLVVAVLPDRQTGHGPRCLYAGHSSDSVEEIAVKLLHARRRSVFESGTRWAETARRSGRE